MSITFSEKNAITDRIRNRINEVINGLEARHANEVKDLKAVKRAEALKQLGMTAAYAELAEKAQQKNEIEARISKLQGILGRGVKAQEGGWCWEENFEASLKGYWVTAYNDALAATDWGVRIAELTREREALVDTVLVATSSTQLKNLWVQFDRLLNIQPTEMQKAILDTPGPAVAE